jgi:hypothetical protein
VAEIVAMKSRRKAIWISIFLTLFWFSSALFYFFILIIFLYF